MVYKTLNNQEIQYIWNNINKSQQINFKEVELSLLEKRVSRVKNEKMFLHIANIDNAVFQATVEYFIKLWAKWTNVPLTTLMISSPWEVYVWQKLDYTTDTLPAEFPNWFWNNRRIFLSESS